MGNSASAGSLLACAIAALAGAKLAGLFGRNVGLVAEAVEALCRWRRSYFYAGLGPLVTRPADIARFRHSDIPDLTGKVALVTGANAGLGYFTALHLAKNGATVIITCRTEQKAVEAAESINAAIGAKRIIPMTAELESLKSVDAFARAFLAKFDKLDIFVPNAGIPGTATMEFTQDNLEKTIQVDHLAHFLMYKRLEPALLKASQQGLVRVAVVSSCFAYLATELPITLDELHDPERFKQKGYYKYAKLMNLLFARELNRRLAGKGVANAAHPGGVASNIWRKYEESVRAKRKSWFAEKVFIPALNWVESNVMWTAEDGALTQLALATKVTTGGDMYHQVFRKVPVSGLAADDELAGKLWAFSEQVLRDRGFDN